VGGGWRGPAPPPLCIPNALADWPVHIRLLLDSDDGDPPAATAAAFQCRNEEEPRF
jgi:hypothetical protein